MFEKDDVHNALSTLLAGRVGLPFSEERQAQLCTEGELRYAKLIPPGYMDSKDKTGERKFGDLILWVQVIEKATSDKKPVILVTDDTKRRLVVETRGQNHWPKTRVGRRAETEILGAVPHVSF